MRRVDAILECVRGPDVLDIGCAGVTCTGDLPVVGGPWWLHGRLRDRFPTVAGIDVSEENVARLRSAGYDVVAADAQDFDLGRRFDTIVAGEVIEHLENPIGFLRSAARHLKGGGRIVGTTPNPFALMHFLYALLNFPRTCPNDDHVAWFCATTLRALAERADLEVTQLRAIEDYEPDWGSRPYRAFVRGVTTFRPLVPIRLRGNSFLFVLGRPAGLSPDAVEDV